ncbi:MAG: trehalose-6-phosphate synthase [Alphaproteobacteria bacterium]|nr:trehalose-6-phosphate synthase [Alphaproteobacteria bacterium]
MDELNDFADPATDATSSHDVIDFAGPRAEPDSPVKPIIVVSNRIPGKRPAAGGLAVALKKVLGERQGFWFGWSGGFSEDYTDEAQFSTIDGLRIGGLDLPEKDYHGYYEGFANSVLWPAFHHRLDLIKIAEEDYDAYCRVNEAFAKALINEASPEHTIWVHDYHLIPLGRELRRLGAKNRIGFFLHIPFPGPEIFSAVPHSADLLSALAAYDLVGLQAQRDVEKLKTQFESATLPSVSDQTQAPPEFLPHSVDAFPIGTDPQAFRQLVGRPRAMRSEEQMVASLAGRALILGIDRLDYSKGLPERIAAYDKLLEKFPKWRRRVHMLQIAPSSRDTIEQYRDISEALDLACGRLMGRFAEPDWAPINYVKRAYPQTALAGLYRAAHVALVTPLRDGMNLVAHEFLACQDPEDPGVLVLSRFAGAAELFAEALLVNPHNIEETADALDQALAMSLKERKARWVACMEMVERHDVDHWAGDFLGRLADVPPWDAKMGKVQSGDKAD